ncbi:MAG: alpha/beta hydrolase family protein [Candidatus Hodarchaeota archaeon]
MVSHISSKIQKLFKKIYKLTKPKYIVLKNKFSEKNFGIIDRLEKIKSISDREKLINLLINVYGIQVEFPLQIKNKVKGIKTIQGKINYDGIFYDRSSFSSYDGLEIPIYVIYPFNFDPNKKYPTIIIFSGHGSAKQAAFEKDSYQHGAGLALSKQGFLVYVMENRGMGKLSYLGSHLRIDAVARIIGGTWYGEIITDALWLVENLHHESNVDNNRIGTAGISTGGALSLIVAALDNRISASYVQGYLGSFKKTFGIRANHCLCGHIPGILKICDMADIASLIAPRPLIFINGTSDIFYYIDAKEEFNNILPIYKELGNEEKLKLLVPKGVCHEFSTDIAIKWFSEQFKTNR